MKEKISVLCFMMAWVFSMPTTAEKLIEAPRLSTKFNRAYDPFNSAYDELRTFGNDGPDPFFKRRLYNTSIAFTAPMFTYYLPGTSDQATISNLVNQAVYGLFGTLAISLIFAVPVLLTGVMYSASNSRSIDAENSWVTSPIMKIENVRRIFNEEFRDEIGLDYTKCMQKTICEAHRSPNNKKYGLLALPFQMFFPPNKEGSTARASSYQLAASDGSNKKIDCGKRYKCFFDTLDLATFLIDWYRLSHDPDYVPKESDFD